MKKNILCSIVLLLNIACSNTKMYHDNEDIKIGGRFVIAYLPDLDMKIQKENDEKITIIAEQFIFKQYPDFDKINKTLVTIDNGDSWLITYLSPKGMFSRAPEIFIDKKTNKITKYHYGQ
jgi:hypothetical protein